MPGGVFPCGANGTRGAVLHPSRVEGGPPAAVVVLSQLEVEERWFIGCRLVRFVTAAVPSGIEQNEPIVRLEQVALSGKATAAAWWTTRA